MKFRITLKDPEGVWESLEHAITESLSGKSDYLDARELADLRKTRTEKYHAAIKRWFKYEEYLTVEIDTEASTCTVIPNDSPKQNRLATKRVAGLY